MQQFYEDVSPDLVGYPIIAVNSGSVSVADALYIDSNGFLAVVTTTSKVLGFCLEKTTIASDNQTVAKLVPKYVPAHAFVKMIYGADQAAVQTDIGAYADLGTVATGTQQLNLLAGATGQFLVLGFNPLLNDNNDEVVVSCAEPQLLAFAQA